MTKEDIRDKILLKIDYTMGYFQSQNNAEVLKTSAETIEHLANAYATLGIDDQI